MGAGRVDGNRRRTDCEVHVKKPEKRLLTATALCFGVGTALIALTGLILSGNGSCAETAAEITFDAGLGLLGCSLVVGIYGLARFA